MRASRSRSCSASSTFLARPAGVDTYTQGALVSCSLTLVTTSTLPLYVASRAAVARALELAPIVASRGTRSRLLVRMDRATRVQRRFLVALAAPVALVAVGSSLLVYAHARAADRAARQADATSFAAGTLDLVEGRDDGRLEALAKGRQLGFAADVRRSDEASAAREGEAVVARRRSRSRAVRALGSGVRERDLDVCCAPRGRVRRARRRAHRRGSCRATCSSRRAKSKRPASSTCFAGSRVYREANFQSVRRLIVRDRRARRRVSRVRRRARARHHRARRRRAQCARCSSRR